MTIAESHEDLRTLPVGSSILTAYRKVFQKEAIEPGRPDSGTVYWIEPGTLQPFPGDGLDHWFPAIVLP